MNDRLCELEVDFGTSIALAAEKIGRMGQSELIPANDIYGIVVHAALLFAATMSKRHMSKVEFTVMAGMVFDRIAELKAPQTASLRQER